ncbi:hypothetical protein ACIQI8_41775 [Streptomyces sp. NPDC092369]|uniref:hypothetical protein n=1 Tax=Streptomyces sp. NPDC092369 TaxID=3366015 RepID=UPI00381D5AF9
MPINTTTALGASTRSGTTSHAPWLVGLPFDFSARAVWLYYVVQDAEDGRTCGGYRTTRWKPVQLVSWT